MNIIRAMPCLVCIHYRTQSGQDTEPNLKRLIQEIERKEFPFLMMIKLWHVFKLPSRNTMATLIKKCSESIPGIGIPFNEVDVNTWSHSD